MAFTIDAIATSPTVAKAITDGGGDYVLAFKCNQPTPHAEVETYFADPATMGLEAATAIETTTRVERRGKTRRETRYFISSAPLPPERAAQAIRSHWGIESLH